MFETLRSRETIQTTVVTGSQQNKWGESEQYKTLNHQAFQEEKEQISERQN
jgi:hypothetical protein